MIMTTVCFQQRAIRMSFLEEVLEGANQLMLSKHYVRALAAYDHYHFYKYELKTVSATFYRGIEH